MEQQALLSGYVRYRPSNKTFYLMINSRRLADFLREKETRVIILREGKLFRITKNLGGNILKPRSRELAVCISGRSILTANENNLITSNSRKSFMTLVILKPQEFGLSLFDLYPDEDAGELAKEIKNLGVELPDRIMTPYTSKFDIFGKYKDSEMTVEITRLAPSQKSRTPNFRHQPIGGNIRAHIFDTYRACVRKKAENKSDLYGFVVLDKRWADYEHIKELLPECRELNCNILFTEFQESWAKDIAKRIKEVINQR